MPRPVRPFRNEPRPLPPLPIHYINDAAGLKAARLVHKKRYDAWIQRRRRALARGELIPEIGRHSQAMQTDAIVPTHFPATTAPPSHVILMLPASMVSLFTPPHAAP